jgi:hypothetical protein
VREPEAVTEGEGLGESAKFRGGGRWQSGTQRTSGHRTTKAVDFDAMVAMQENMTGHILRKVCMQQRLRQKLDDKNKLSGGGVEVPENAKHVMIFNANLSASVPVIDIIVD